MLQATQSHAPPSRFPVRGAPDRARPCGIPQEDFRKTAICWSCCQHIVRQGPIERFTGIARRYGASLKDLFKWNGWSKDPVLKVGDKVTVYRKK